MSWTTPKTWTTEPLTSLDLNTHLRDNLNALKEPPTAVAVSPDSDYSTSSTVFVPVSTANYTLSLTTQGGDVLVGFSGSFAHSVNGTAFFNLELNGTLVVADDGLLFVQSLTNAIANVTFTQLLTNVPAGNNSIKLMWKTNTPTAFLYAGGLPPGSGKVHSQFWAREI